MKKKWIYPKKYNNNCGEKLDSSVVLRLLKQRGLGDAKEQEEFLSEKPKKTYDPFLLKNMKEAVHAILDTLNAEQTICIYGDYDADGVTSCSLLLEILGKLTSNLFYYIPSRFEEGYGFHKTAIDKIKDLGANLIITVDCGSTSLDEVEYAKEMGISVIVTDHHTIVNGKVPDCIFINPKQEDCNYPFSGLSGCGVAFKLAQAIQRTLENERDARSSLLTKKELNRVLDLVAISTIGDIVPLVDENRTLVKYGLKRIQKGNRYGLEKLIEAIGLSKKIIKSDNIAYSIVPHLNAAGRMESAKIGVELLVTSGNNKEEIQKIKNAVNQLLEKNNERKRVQEETFSDCMQIAERINESDLFLLIDSEKIHEGIAGIVAGKLKDCFSKPTALVTLCEDGIHYKGTGRSIEGIDLYKLLHTQSLCFERFGGHAGACGFLLKKENIAQLRDGLNAHMGELIKENPMLLSPTLYINERLEAEELTEQLIEQLECFEPFGHCNEKPLFLIEKLIIREFRYMGESKEHIRFKAMSLTGEYRDFILFSKASDYKETIKIGAMIDVVGYPTINQFRGVTNVQFIVYDMK
ncbi:single-stranded-DNA-specific exonuclease RecJ [Anaerovorax sp. IOR16]|uniref:single-stranded-DNA-specific exonuclease RecJ n=1 Tax=Anaerovorax sp. IOR16 TaxID=2773458 RepID=UPI0019D27A9E|nr:single-stranded-DNA-specific exonuclease RecJ [Anaerovorax sp. IOR16]